MSIDRDVFTEWMGELDDHFPGDRSERIIAVYWRALSGRMDTEAFETACVRILGERDYFPPWKAFVEAVRGDAEEGAIEAWDRVLEMAKDWRNAKPSEVLSEAGQKALRQVGGVKKLALMDREDLDFRRNDFIGAYRAAAASVERQRDELPPMSDEGREVIDRAGAGMKSLEPS